MSKINYKPMHLTITYDGQVSLWDSESAARRGAAKGEVYVALELNDAQLVTLKRAARSATITSKGERVNTSTCNCDKSGPVQCDQHGPRE